MLSVMFCGDRVIELRTLPEPDPQNDQVVVEVQASGMCGSDLHVYRGAHRAEPIVGGHEPAGVVTKLGPGVSQEWLGRRVMVHHYFGCGHCDQCRAGWTQLCRQGSTAMGGTAPGSHTERIVVPLQSVIPMPDGLSFLAAAAISCGTGTAWGALHRLQLRGDDTIAIFGQGPVGLAATQLAHAMGARVIALDISAPRLERSRQFGAWEVINPAEVTSVAEAVRTLTDGRGVAKSLETSGASSAAHAALDVLDLWGAACWVGIGSSINFELTDYLFKQVSAMTSWTLSIPAMAECARFVVERRIDVDRIFTDQWNLEDAVEAYRLFDQQTSGKGVLVPARALRAP